MVALVVALGAGRRGHRLYSFLIRRFTRKPLRMPFAAMEVLRFVILSWMFHVA